MPDIENSHASENDPPKKRESDKKRKRESDNQKGPEEPSKTKARKELDRFLNLQRYHADLKADLGQPKPELHSPLGDVTNTQGQETSKPKAFTASELQLKEINQTTDSNKVSKDNNQSKIFDKFNPFSVDLMHETLQMRQDIPKLPSSDNNQQKKQD